MAAWVRSHRRTSIPRWRFHPTGGAGLDRARGVAPLPETKQIRNGGDVIISQELRNYDERFDNKPIGLISIAVIGGVISIVIGQIINVVLGLAH